MLPCDVISSAFDFGGGPSPSEEQRLPQGSVQGKWTDEKCRLTASKVQACGERSVLQRLLRSKLHYPRSDHVRKCPVLHKLIELWLQVRTDVVKRAP